MRKYAAIRLSSRDILFENEDYIAVNKRRGWLIHQSVDEKRPDLFRALGSYLRRKGGADSYLALHHRLDLWTSGVVIFSKSDRANEVLASIFKERKATKSYLAICVGRPPQESGDLVDFLKKKVVNRMQRMVKVHKGGQKAITKYKCVEESAGRSLVEFQLITGRMHQIRVQSSLAGFPILGDTMYGEDGGNTELRGALLHAFRLEFFDPLSGKTVRIEAGKPDELEEYAPGEIVEKQSPVGRSSSGKFRYLLFHKPYGVLCQFTPNTPGEPCLGDFELPKNVYAVGRLDKDSEGLLLLTDDGKTNHRLSHPKHNKKKTYWVQVEGVPDNKSLAALRRGVVIKKHQCLPCEVHILPDFDFPERVPAIRERKSIPTTWIQIVLSEGKNRQVRRMTAAVGYPTLRLVRASVDEFVLDGLAPGEMRDVIGFGQAG